MLRRAIFLDRDGTLTADRVAGSAAERLSLLTDAVAAVRGVNRAGWQVVVVTNQPAVAAGGLDEDTLADLHERLRADLLEDDARIDGIYHCPHDPAATVELYRRACRCRLPGVGLFERARDEMGIDLTSSFFVGAARAFLPDSRLLGMPSILLQGAPDETPPTHADPDPAKLVRTLEQAVTWALQVRC